MTTRAAEGLYQRLARTDTAIVESARYFSIDEARMDAFLEKIPGLFNDDLLSEDIHLIDRGDRERTLNYLFALEAVNFGGPYSKKLRAEGFHEEGLGLYETVALRLKRHFERSAALPAAQMARLGDEDVRDIFRFDSSKPLSGQLCTMFRESLAELGEFVEGRFGGSFSALLDSAEGSVENLVATLWDVPKFRDIHSYTMPDGTEIEVPVLKRAQHVAGSIALALPRIGEAEPFRDLHKLTAFPDNKISHVMLVEGILKPTDEARSIIESGQTVPVGAAIEVENRVFGRHIVRLMAEKTGQRMVDLDHWIWTHSHYSALLGGVRYSDVPHLMTEAPSFNY